MRINSCRVSIDLLQVVGFRVLYAKRRPCALCQPSRPCALCQTSTLQHIVVYLNTSNTGGDVMATLSRSLHVLCQPMDSVDMFMSSNIIPIGRWLYIFGCINYNYLDDVYLCLITGRHEKCKQQ